MFVRVDDDETKQCLSSLGRVELLLVAAAVTLDFFQGDLGLNPSFSFAVYLLRHGNWQ